MSLPGLDRHFFRQSFGPLVSSLCRKAGMAHLEAAEDAVQAAMLRAVEIWPRAGLPDNPAAWLHAVASNRLLDDLRKHRRHRDILDRSPDLLPAEMEDDADPRYQSELSDDLLRMLFTACDGEIPAGSQIAFALRTLCGFSVSEIAFRLFATDANIYQRLSRARAILRRNGTEIADLGASELQQRLPTVQRVLYLLFAEGFHSTHAERTVRRDLCDEAIRLSTLLAAHPVGRTSDSFALLALMHLLVARLDALADDDGALVLLAEQDRSRFDARQIEIGLGWLSRATGGEVSRWHAEAGIAAEHCLAPTYEATNWQRIVECYDLLDHLAPSPVHRLNRAVALAELRGPAAGLEALAGETVPRWLEGSYQWAAVKADLYRRAGDAEAAALYTATALDLTSGNLAVQAMLRRRLGTNTVTGVP